MRNAFADELLKIASENDNVVMLSADIGNKLFDKFKEAFPDRFQNCGVAEANTIGVAAGLAMNGFRPIAYTITPFITNRCLEHIRDDLCYQNQNVIVVGVGAGLSYTELGPTHQSCEDIGILRTLPNMTVLCPGDAMEVRGALRAALKHDGPVYIRLGKKGERVVHASVPELVIGKAITMKDMKLNKDGKNVCLLSTGNMLPIVMDTGQEVERYDISVKVLSFPTVKPLDVAALTDTFSKYDLVCTIEEHSLIGGFGSSVAEWMIDNNIQKRLLRFGTEDKFFHEAGDQLYSREHNGLTVHAMTEKILKTLK